MNKFIDADKLIAEIERYIKHYEKLNRDEFKNGELYICQELLSFIKSLQQEQPGVDLEKFTEKMNDWKARFNRPDDIPIKATMAFTARMFYMYPKAAREWYESLPKATMDYARKEENK